MKLIKVLFVVVLALQLAKIVCAQQSKEISELEVLDHNKDGIVNPYEALDVLLHMQQQNKSELRVKALHRIVTDYRENDLAEMESIIEELDANDNGTVEFNEVEDEEFLHFIRLMDSDGTKSVTRQEIADFRMEDAMFMNDKAIRKEIKHIFRAVGKADEIDVTDLDEEVKSEFSDWDLNSDNKITKAEAFTFMKANNIQAEFKVQGNIAYMKGVICSSTPARVLQLVFEHPDVTTIEMLHVPGSVDDVSNLRASLYIKQFGLNTQLNKQSIIASGGTDFFLAGAKRTVAKGAKIGVHSWGGGARKATDLPKNHKEHIKYLHYYNQVNIPEEFYWYTLEAAPAESIHNMTEEEIVKYKIRKE